MPSISLARRCAIRTAPFEPSSPGDEITSAPMISSNWRRSGETFSGRTTLSL